MSISDGEPSPAKSSRVTMDLTLRSPQLQFLQYIAERDDIPLSHALEKVLALAASEDATTASRKALKVRKHFSVGTVHIEFLDMIATRLGLYRSDAARRLIDDFRAKGRSV